MKTIRDLDILIPISLELDWPTVDSIVADIREQYERYGFTRFMLACPSGGWRSYGFPPASFFRERAEMFVKIKERLNDIPVECGWWITATLKSGSSPEFSRMVRPDGTETPFASCPLDERFRKRFAENAALFASIAKPTLIMTEDDFSIVAGAFYPGCFCEHHLSAFAEKTGHTYTREELVKKLSEKGEGSLELMRRWRELNRDALVGFAAELRRAIDEKNPEIPIGYMQAGCADIDGDCTYAISKALAGERHAPFSRLYGTFYNGGRFEDIPGEMFHCLYDVQHLPEDLVPYHESDTFPHTRYFASGALMRTIMTTAYAYGFVGSTFQTQQLLDEPNEEKIYGDMFRKNRPVFESLHRAASGCRMRGVELCYDPFDNTASLPDNSTVGALWTKTLSLMGIPYTTTKEKVACWDKAQAKFADDDTVMSYLTQGLLLDGEAAACLCERGYGKYLGVEVTYENVAEGNLGYDLGAREVIVPSFRTEGRGQNMPSPHMFACGRNGYLHHMTVTDPACEVLSELVTFRGENVAPGMTRFVNELGGRIVVMGMSLAGNESQSLFNYRRARLLRSLIDWCGGDMAYVKDAAKVYLIENEAIDPIESGFRYLFTVSDLGGDGYDELSIHLPEALRGNGTVWEIMQEDGSWRKASCAPTIDGILLCERLSPLSSCHLRAL